MSFQLRDVHAGKDAIPDNVGVRRKADTVDLAVNAIAVSTYLLI